MIPVVQLQFIQQIAPIVQYYCKERGYRFASPIIAQATVESFKGQGLSGLASEYNNFFGMKAGSSWKGKVVNLSTKEEYTVGTLTTIKSGFRVYDDMDSGVKGYFDFISTTRYANLKKATSPQDYLEKIKADGYATSSSYVKTNMQRITMYNLTQYDNFTVPEVSDARPKTGNPYPEPQELIKQGSRGNGVRWLQFSLNEKGYGLIVDGIAGAMTIGALLDFQKKAGLVVDGLCGPATRQALLS